MEQKAGSLLELFRKSIESSIKSDFMLNIGARRSLHTGNCSCLVQPVKDLETEKKEGVTRKRMGGRMHRGTKA